MSTNFEPNEYFIFGQSTKIGTHENKAIHSMLHLANTEFCCQYHNDVCHINYNDISRRHHQYYEKRMGVNIVHCFYVDDFIHFASRKKYQSPRCRRDPGIPAFCPRFATWTTRQASSWIANLGHGDGIPSSLLQGGDRIQLMYTIWGS